MILTGLGGAAEEWNLNWKIGTFFWFPEKVLAFSGKMNHQKAAIKKLSKSTLQTSFFPIGKK